MGLGSHSALVTGPAFRLFVGLGGLAVPVAAPVWPAVLHGRGAGKMPSRRPRAHLCPSREGRASALGCPSRHTAGTWNLAGAQNLGSALSPSCDRRGGHSTGAPGDEGQRCGWPWPPPTSHCARGALCRPPHPQAPPLPSGLPLCREWDRLSASSEICCDLKAPVRIAPPAAKVSRAAPGRRGR